MLLQVRVALNITQSVLALLKHRMHKFVGILVKLIETLDAVDIDAHFVTAFLALKVEAKVFEFLGIEAQLLD